MKIIITGATGMVGKGVLLESLDDPQVKQVLCIGRRSLNMKHEKLLELIHPDFSNFESVRDQLEGYDAAFLCMGVSSAGMSESDYAHLTYDLTMALVNVLYEIKTDMTITYVSGQGTDSSEKGRVMWARVKGRTENAILQKGFKGAYMFRPGVIIPLRGIRSSTKLYQFFYDYFMWMIKLFKMIFPRSIVNTTQLGKAMIQVSLDGYEKSIIDPPDILKLGS